MNFIYSFLYKKEKQAYSLFRERKKIKLSLYFFLFIKGFFNFIESLIRNISGPFGYVIRRYYYKFIFKKMGDDILIDIGVIFNGPQNIECGNRVWFDCYLIINTPFSKVKIGSNVHLAAHSYMGGRDDIIISDNCGISVGSRIFTGSINILADKNLPILNPMIEETANEKGFIYGPVTLEKDSCILSNCVISPNVTLKKGSLLLSNSFLTSSTEEYGIYSGTPAKLVSKRF
jgi:acetyltransferase-like isoleucine patch superfamily enzyme